MSNDNTKLIRKGGLVCVKDDSNNKTFLQCQHCGHIFDINKRIPMKYMYINNKCKKCGETRMLNCGHNRDDIYELMDINIDSRYYSY